MSLDYREIEKKVKAVPFNEPLEVKRAFDAIKRFRNMKCSDCGYFNYNLSNCVACNEYYFDDKEKQLAEAKPNYGIGASLHILQPDKFFCAMFEEKKI